MELQCAHPGRGSFFLLDRLRRMGIDSRRAGVCGHRPGRLESHVKVRRVIQDACFAVMRQAVLVLLKPMYAAHSHSVLLLFRGLRPLPGHDPCVVPFNVAPFDLMPSARGFPGPQLAASRRHDGHAAGRFPVPRNRPVWK